MKVHGRVVLVSGVLGLLSLAPFSATAQMRMAGQARPPMRVMRMPRATHLLRSAQSSISYATRPYQADTLGLPPVSFGPPPPGFGNQFGSGYGGSGGTLGQLVNPVPGLGFDYSYLNAINSDLGIKAFIDPQTQWEIASAEQAARATGGYGAGGYYLLDGGGGYIVPAPETATGQVQESSQPPQPTVIVLQEQAKQPVAQEPAVPPQPATPLPNVSNFTLVLQNGTKIEAIAFTRVGDNIVYIAADGSRHTIPASRLNATATEQLNAASGTQVRL